ncbi:MAG: OmpA family protein [gamma proteobacterium endosymbiont of Lamellibrachia anaximandri]|nr:OmpA family protein [gamma proteobacterium endosymbiont of Lamellibrachia anaximandri]
MKGQVNNGVGFDLHNVEEEDHWISVSDLMAGLMMVFLFVSIALMRTAFLERDEVKVERDKIQEIAIAYQENQVAIYDALVEEFDQDLEKWSAVVDQNTLSFEFQSPEVLFDRAEITLKPAFQDILVDFFPRYLRVLGDYRLSINEVRIEGHTSSDWNRFTSSDEAYFKNMELSQGRTRSVLEYVYLIDGVEEDRPWIIKSVAAVGFSSSHLKLSEDGGENPEASRRVTFRVITNAETQIRKIIEN